jgi:hypothetical protein
VTTWEDPPLGARLNFVEDFIRLLESFLLQFYEEVFSEQIGRPCCFAVPANHEREQPCGMRTSNPKMNVQD